MIGVPALLEGHLSIGIKTLILRMCGEIRLPDDQSLRTDPKISVVSRGSWKKTQYESIESGLPIRNVSVEDTDQSDWGDREVVCLLADYKLKFRGDYYTARSVFNQTTCTWLQIL